MVKSLVRKNWTWGNFYLGVDIALAALANSIVNVVDLAHHAEEASVQGGSSFGNQMGFTAISIVTAVAALFATMGLHQHFDAPEDDAASENGNRRIKRGILLGIFGNLIGACAFGLFIYWKLKGLI